MKTRAAILICVVNWLPPGPSASCHAGDARPVPSFSIVVEKPHAWRPPFGLDRVGAPTTVRVEAAAPPGGRIWLAERERGRETARREIRFPGKAPFVATAAVAPDTTEAAVLVEEDGTPAGAARTAIERPPLEAEAAARPDRVVNPVDLGTILVPAGWLLLGPGQAGILEVAALSRVADRPHASVRARFASGSAAQAAALPLIRGKRARAEVRMAMPPGQSDRDTLRVELVGEDGTRLWGKDIPVMIVRRPPDLPRFGATYTKLRYDAPISVRDPATGAFSSLDYDRGWEPSLRDVVVSLPGGGRFVFWRGSSYIPFWAGLHNTGACYEWAEVITRRPGAVDCVEPLMDKELRYGRVEIVEATPALVHVRWTYESTDLNYKVWGDQAVEDYYFHPDGYGTRVVTLKTDPTTDYELCEFIILTPQGAYPFDALPENLVDALSLDGSKRSYRFPIRGEADTPRGGAPPAVYRLRPDRSSGPAAIAFNPGDRAFPKVVFGPFEDGGRLVTPCYWGSHWPLARGNATGSRIDDRIALTPCHNSVMSWASDRPEPISERRGIMVDTLGEARTMVVRRWAWLIGMTRDDDEHLLRRARAFANPPSLKLEGAEPASEGYAIERRALCLRVRRPDVTIALEPSVACVDPIFELDDAPRGALSVRRDGVPVPEADLAWDGRTLWLRGSFAARSRLDLHFESTTATTE
ncbi:hypothetical protein OJF2_19380 [Aquisphaera giovannonii]|uniref:Uncharacterized protein n=1 Tax=Aquisphaera giovannonii TaxID=406548 RepID=A0A5B9VYJ1_9BACT|nr:hypothetical protein [Aquisphaera giovannonii]QEH33436.1 hypothetical protein OJF2_19380 [Aquisphaera giovannonii]